MARCSTWAGARVNACDYRDLPRPGQKSQIIKATHKVAGEKFTNTLVTPDFLKHIDVGAFD
jgi:hypothetical protein